MQNKIKNYFYHILLLPLISALVLGQEISGVVKNKNGTPQAGANINVEG